MFREIRYETMGRFDGGAMTRYWLMKCEPDAYTIDESETRRPHQLGRVCATIRRAT